MKIDDLFQKLRGRRSLRSRIILGLIGYLIILTLGVLANDFVVNERAEELVWNSSLNSEMDYLIGRRDKKPDYEWPDNNEIAMFELDSNNQRHAPLLKLEPGLHDEILFEDNMRVILIRNVDGRSIALLLNIENLEKTENSVENAIFMSAAIVSIILCLLVAWASGWLVKPLNDLARQIQQLAPDVKNQQILLPKNSSVELEIIADAMNTYIKRNELFLEREREFINMASHELRTPLSVIDGVVKLSLDDSDLSGNTKNRLFRIQDSISNVNEMITLLLVLAKDPHRIKESSELIFLDQVLIEIIKEHRFLAENKNVSIALQDIARTEIFAPLQMVKCALGNLLRNAIEHSHGGDIFIKQGEGSTVIIENRNDQLTLQEISELYGRLARKNSRYGSGLGLDLISRLCTHCNWELSFIPDAETITFSVKFS